MKSTSNAATLLGYSRALLDLPSEEEAQIKANINEICYLYEDITGNSGRNTESEYMTNVPTAVGVSLSFNHAASCITDYNRTHKLLKGIVQAIQDKQKEHPGETIRVFYAGCGPFALFMTIVAPLFDPKEVQFTLLEVNKKSIEVAKHVVATLKLDAYLDECHTADAIMFDIPNPEKYHILFSETLDSMLNRECYVPILWNMLPQLNEDVAVIPENVQITVNYKKGEEEVPFVTAFDTREVLKETPKTDLLPKNFATKSFSMEEAEKYDSIVLDTFVRVYKEHVLNRSESSISLALEVPIKKPFEYDFIEFIYQLQPTPALQMGVR